GLSNAFLLAGVAGIEPAIAVLETDVIPLHHTPILDNC
ncbi:MAG: hypothetical protein ACD_76C00031G0001, partial [uncultured bacterium]